MNFVNEMEVGKGVDLPRPGCRPADVDGSSGPFFTEDDGATGQGLEVARMADLDSRNIRNGIHLLHSEGYYQKGRRAVNDTLGEL